MQKHNHHSRAGGNPILNQRIWIPVFTGMIISQLIMNLSSGVRCFRMTVYPHTHTDWQTADSQTCRLFNHALQGLCLFFTAGSFRQSSAMFTSWTIWKSYMPTQIKSAPLSKANLNPSSGWIAPAARILKPIHG